MNFKKILLILIFLINPSYTLNKEVYVAGVYSSFAQQQEIKYPLKHGKPTTTGINYYVQVNKYNIKKEVENYIKDSITLNVEISTDDLSEYTSYDSLDLAYHFTYPDGGDEIILDNRERYVAYDINDLSNFKKFNLTKYNAFVKTALVHELIHTYFLQTIIKAKSNGLNINREYDYKMSTQLKMYPNPEESYGATFIEEGICQFVVEQMKLEIPYRLPTPKTIKDIINKNEMKYTYSVDYLKDFINQIGLKQAIILIITNKPPTYEELLEPNLFFNRLK